MDVTVSGRPVRVVVADDHPVFSDGLSRVLTAGGRIEVVGQAATGPEAFELIARHRPDVALVDLQMPGLDGARVAEAVLRDELGTRVLIVSAYDDVARVYDALGMGAAGFIGKESTPAEVVDAVLDCAAGHDVIPPRLAAGLAAEIRRRADPSGAAVSRRKREVVKLIAAEAGAGERRGTVPVGGDGGRGRAPRSGGAAVRAQVVRALDFLVCDSLPIRTLLRLALIGLIGLLVSVSHVDHWLDAAFVTLLAGYALAAVAWLVFLLRTPYRRWYSWAATVVDVVFVVALCIVSGSATVWLFPVFLLLPLPVAFLESPLVTAVLGAAAAAGYLIVWIVYSARTEQVRLPGLVYVQVCCVLWVTVALSMLAYSLRRRAGRVESLLEVRRRLVAEVMQAGARNSRVLSEQLHDGPLQNLLAARFDLDELRTDPSPESIERVDSALLESIAALRSAVSTLHPQVLDQAGLTAAVRQLVAGYEQRWAITVDAELEEVGHPAGQAMLYRAARELLGNVAKHAGAGRLRVQLRRTGNMVTLLVADDGIGFDPDVLADRVAQGHIGLASLVAGIEAMGGSVRLDTASGAGTTVTVSLPSSVTARPPQVPGPR